MSKSKPINILPMIAKAIAIKPDLRPDIDKVFELVKTEFDYNILGDEFFNHRLFRESDIDTEIYMRKAANCLALLHAEEAETIGEGIISVVKRGYKRVWQYISSNKQLQYDEIAKLIPENINDNYLTFAVVCFLGQENGNVFPLHDSRFMRSYQHFLDLIREYDDPEPIRFNLSKDQEKIKDIVMSTFDIAFKNGYPKTIGEWRMSEMFSSSETLIAMEHLVESYGYTAGAIDSLPVSRKDLELAVRAWAYEVESPEDCQDILVIVDSVLKTIYAMGFVRLYNRARELVLDNLTTVTVKELSAEIKRLSEELENQKLVSSKKQDELNISQIAADKQTAELLSKQEEIEDLKERNAMLQAALEQAEQIPDEKHLDQVDISGLNIVIAGGHDNWQQRILETYPNVTAINTVTFDVDLIRNADIVVFNWSYAAHKLYNRVIGLTRQHNKKIAYVGSTGLEAFENSIKTCL